LARRLQVQEAFDPTAMTDESSETEIMRALALYLQANPLASDTADGIRRWWLGAQGALSLDEVSRALDTMKMLGLIEITYAADGRRRYRRNATDEQLAAFVEGFVDDAGEER